MVDQPPSESDISEGKFLVIRVRHVSLIIYSYLITGDEGDGWDSDADITDSEEEVCCHILVTSLRS